MLSGCLGAAQIIKSVCVAGAGLVCFFSSLVIMSLSLEEQVDVEVGSEEWEEMFLEKLLVQLKETVKEKEAGVPQSGASGLRPSLCQSEGTSNIIPHLLTNHKTAVKQTVHPPAVLNCPTNSSTITT